MKTTSLTSLLRALVASPQTKPAAVAAMVSSAPALRELDVQALRQVSGGAPVELPKRGW
jgi:hypothetical protein